MAHLVDEIPYTIYKIATYTCQKTGYLLEVNNMTIDFACHWAVKVTTEGEDGDDHLLGDMGRAWSNHTLDGLRIQLQQFAKDRCMFSLLLARANAGTVLMLLVDVAIVQDARSALCLLY